MAAKFFLVKSLVRRALQDEEFAWVSNLEDARKVLEALHAGQYTAIDDAEARATRVRTTFGSKTFEWSVPEALSQLDIMELAERALEWIERVDTVEEARALLVRRKNSRVDFSGMRL